MGCPIKSPRCRRSASPLPTCFRKSGQLSEFVVDQRQQLGSGVGILLKFGKNRCYICHILKPVQPSIPTDTIGTPLMDIGKEVPRNLVYDQTSGQGKTMSDVTQNHITH